MSRGVCLVGCRLVARASCPLLYCTGTPCYGFTVQPTTGECVERKPVVCLLRVYMR